MAFVQFIQFSLSLSYLLLFPCAGKSSTTNDQDFTPASAVHQTAQERDVERRQVLYDRLVQRVKNGLRKYAQDLDKAYRHPYFRKPTSFLVRLTSSLEGDLAQTRLIPWLETFGYEASVLRGNGYVFKRNVLYLNVQVGPAEEQTVAVSDVLASEPVPLEDELLTEPVGEERLGLDAANERPLQQPRRFWKTPFRSRKAELKRGSSLNTDDINLAQAEMAQTRTKAAVGREEDEVVGDNGGDEEEEEGIEDKEEEEDELNGFPPQDEQEASLDIDQEEEEEDLKEEEGEDLRDEDIPNLERDDVSEFLAGEEEAKEERVASWEDEQDKDLQAEVAAYAANQKSTLDSPQFPASPLTNNQGKEVEGGVFDMEDIPLSPHFEETKV